MGRRGQGKEPVGDVGPGRAIVVDASAILVLLYGEPGQGEIRGRLRGITAYAGSVNFSEVAAKLAEGGFTAEEIRDAVRSLGLEILPFDEELALAAGLLRPSTSGLGLSLGDRACLAFAHQIGALALTTDTAWDGLDNVAIIER